MRMIIILMTFYMKHYWVLIPVFQIDLFFLLCYLWPLAIWLIIPSYQVPLKYQVLLTDPWAATVPALRFKFPTVRSSDTRRGCSTDRDSTMKTTRKLSDVRCRQLAWVRTRPVQPTPYSSPFSLLLANSMRGHTLTIVVIVSLFPSIPDWGR